MRILAEQGMTVRIVGHGEQEVRRVICGRCSGILEYGKSDVLSEPRYDITGDYDGERRWIAYPQCKSQVELAD